MLCLELADTSDEAVMQLWNSCSEHHPEVFDALVSKQATDVSQMTVRLAVAATGGHVALEDDFFWDTLYSLRDAIGSKKLHTWKVTVTSEHGMKRRLVFQDKMIRLRDDAGRMVPVVPAQISECVKAKGNYDFAEAFKRVPSFRQKHDLKTLAAFGWTSGSNTPAIECVRTKGGLHIKRNDRRKR